MKIHQDTCTLTYRIEGITPTDHNVRTATICTGVEMEKGKPDDWIMSNQYILKDLRNTKKETTRPYTNLITRSINTTIGFTVISTNKMFRYTTNR